MFRESGEMCAMKEVTLFSDDAKSKESAKQLMQVNRFPLLTLEIFVGCATVILVGNTFVSISVSNLV